MQAAEFRRELTENILPFWIEHTVDRENGGFYGAVSCDLKVQKDAPRAAVINTRILWTFSAAYRLLGNPEYREMADRAYAYILDKFWDKQYGACTGRRLSGQSDLGAQADLRPGVRDLRAGGILPATGEAESLARAQELFRLIEEKSWRRSGADIWKRAAGTGARSTICA